jgi:hypothetical protein
MDFRDDFSPSPKFFNGAIFGRISLSPSKEARFIRWRMKRCPSYRNKQAATTPIRLNLEAVFNKSNKSVIINKG